MTMEVIQGRNTRPFTIDSVRLAVNPSPKYYNYTGWVFFSYQGAQDSSSILVDTDHRRSSYLFGNPVKAYEFDKPEALLRMLDSAAARRWLRDL
jgi:hypothetical protein